MLNVWRLTLLRELASRGTIRAVADAMNVTASAVSQQLATLERESGTVLLERAGRQLRLTDAGTVLARHAATITAAVGDAESELAALRRVVSGTLRIAAIPTVARAVMPSVLTGLGHRHPHLRVTLRDLEAQESIRAVDLDEIDIAVIDDYEEAAEPGFDGMIVRELFRDPVYVAMSSGRTIADGVDLASLRSEYWIMDVEASRFFTMSTRACRARGFEPKIRSNCKDFAVIVALIEAGLGVGLLPRLALHDRAAGIVVARPMPALERRVLAVVRRERFGHPAIRSAISELTAFVQPTGSLRPGRGAS